VTEKSSLFSLIKSSYKENSPREKANKTIASHIIIGRKKPIRKKRKEAKMIENLFGGAPSLFLNHGDNA